MQKMLLYKGGIESCLKAKIYTDFCFSKNTTYKLGGKAKIAYFPTNIPQAIQSFTDCKNKGISSFVIGNGSNVLAASSGYDGAVISTKKLSGIIKLSEDRIFCLAGTTVSCLLNYCKNKGLGGAEYLAGIPATVGGLVFMNGGACGHYICENVEKVYIFDGKKYFLTKNQCNFTYKQSTMRNIKCLILGVVLKLNRTRPQIVEENIWQCLSNRSRLALGRSCGCVFKNSPEYFAGELIDKCGLKGVRLGGAYVSEKHANFILSDGDNSSDVFRLISIVKKVVYNKFAVKLCEEVVYIGDFNETDR